MQRVGAVAIDDGKMGFRKQGKRVVHTGLLVKRVASLDSRTCRMFADRHTENVDSVGPAPFSRRINARIRYRDRPRWVRVARIRTRFPPLKSRFSCSKRLGWSSLGDDGLGLPHPSSRREMLWNPRTIVAVARIPLVETAQVDGRRIRASHHAGPNGCRMLLAAHVKRFC